MRIKSLLICLVSFIGILSVDASTIEITGGKDKIKTNEVVEYQIKLKDVGEDKFNLVEFEIEYNNALLEFEGGKSNNYNTQEVYSGNNAFITLPSGTFADGVITSFKLKNLSLDSGNTTFKIKNVKFKNGDDEVGTMASEVTKTLNLVYSTTTTTTTTTTRAKNTSAKVKSIKFNNATMKPAFDANKKEYKLYTKDTIRQLTMIYDTEQTGVVLKGDCTLGCTISDSSDNIVKTVIGKNEVTFTFTSEDGKNTETYKFTIYRGETTDGSNKLSSLVVKEFNINEKFDSDVLDYTVSVPFETEKVEVEAVSADSEASVKIKGADKLEVGENTITITVTPTDEEEDVKIYNITVTREEFVEEEPTTTAPIVPEEETKNNKNNNVLIIVLVSVGLIIIGLSAYFIFFYKGNNKKKPKDGTKEQKIENLSSDAEMPKTKESNVIDKNFEEKEPTVEEALMDLMETKEINNNYHNDI